MKLCDVFQSSHDDIYLVDYQHVIAKDMKTTTGFDVVGRIISSTDMRVTKKGTKEKRVMNCNIENERR